ARRPELGGDLDRDLGFDRRLHELGLHARAVRRGPGIDREPHVSSRRTAGVPDSLRTRNRTGMRSASSRTCVTTPTMRLSRVSDSMVPATTSGAWGSAE